MPEVTHTAVPLKYPITAGLAFLITAWFGYRESPLGQLLFAVSLLTVPCMLIALLVRIRRDRWSAAFMALVVAAAVPLGGRLGYMLRRVDFEHRLRPAYEVLVARIERGEIPMQDVPMRTVIAEDMQGLAYAVHAWRDETGILTVEFFWGRGFPVKHTAFVYRSSGAWSDDPRLWWRGTHLIDNWFQGRD